MSSSDPEPVSRREKLDALRDVARYNPTYTAAVVVLGIVAAVLEGVGLSFILPIVELVQLQDPAAEADGLLAVFVTAYQTLGIPFTLGYVVVGVSAVMIARYTTSFSVAWFREALRTYYIRDLQTWAFRNALNARVEYFDKEGSDDILNAIVTQTNYAGRVIDRGVKFTQQLFLAGVYFAVALIIAPVLTIITGVVLGGFWYWESGEYSPRRFYYGWMPLYPTVFVRREIYDQYGTFDLDFPIAADYEFLLRVLLKKGVSPAYVDDVFVRMATGGQSNSSVRNIVVANLKVYGS